MDEGKKTSTRTKPWRLNPASECEAADQRHQEQNQEHEKEYLGDSCGRDGYAAEAKDRSNNRNHQEDSRPAKHKTSGCVVRLVSEERETSGEGFPKNEPPLGIHPTAGTVVQPYSESPVSLNLTADWLTELGTYAGWLSNSPAKPLPLQGTKGHYRTITIVAFVVLAIVTTATILLAAKWPFTQAKVVTRLESATSANIRVRSFRAKYFPPGCLIEGAELR